VRFFFNDLTKTLVYTLSTTPMDRRTFITTTTSAIGLLGTSFKLSAQTPKVTFRWVPSTDLQS
jgi:hypothetical protein